VVLVWGVGTFLVSITASASRAMLGWQIAVAGGLFISVFFYHTIYILANLNYKKILMLVYLQAIACCLLSTFWGKTVVYGSMQVVIGSFLYPERVLPWALMMFGWVIVAVLAYFELYKFVKRAKGLQNIQGHYLLAGFAIGFLGGGSVLLPALGVPLYPVGNFGIALYSIILTYAILRYRLMDVRVAFTRLGIFFIVYTCVLGVPFLLVRLGRPWLVGVFGSGWYWLPLFLLASLATAGPFSFIFLSAKAEARLRAEEQHAHDLLKQASEGMMRIHNLRELISLISHITCKTLKLENAAVFLVDEDSGDFNLFSVRLRSKYNYLERLNSNDPLVEKLSTMREPLVYEELKIIAQDQRHKPKNSIREIESQMRRLSAAVIVPAISKGRLLAFLVLSEKKSKKMYSQEDLGTLWALSYQAALAIENAFLYEKEKMWLAQQSKRQALADMAPGASHQFNNRLIAISSTAENLLDLLKNDSQEISKGELVNTVSSDLETVIDEVMKGKQITEAILQKAKAKLDFGKVDIIKIIQSAINLTNLRRTRESLGGAEIPEFFFNHPKEMSLLNLCEGPMQDVFENMFNNAVDAIVIKDKRNPEPGYRGKISIDLSKEEKSILVRIEDNGIGMPKESLPKLFTPYFTSKSTSEKGVLGGSGLGLWVMRDFVERHGGTIAVDSEDKKWTRFTIKLPLDFKPPK